MEKAFKALTHIAALVCMFLLGQYFSLLFNQYQMVKECEKAGKPCEIVAISTIAGLK